ncbi:MAG: tetratricopeptide repeat protein [Lentimicrobiaceae bacterium]|jgi:tetratricopeptide (TPR) repeat protein|nr:tetratricopeptide repeat protein [Lentimicrobiaceae bacterium]MCP4910381.1 tetratricopeptide repeat protein [Bacteroidota bacterium]MBT3454555.1 tetratricopeptide repeat protein [Lentimicrobiaceae bacterium]MBT3818149.1 tetratricopeptide repeat protein [Lentimicrobiaceae bacterium]MBT4061432.1 tetratricopeptide repeat protein [Lentimicrobiaceae bacterium]
MSLLKKSLLFLGVALISLNVDAQTVSDAGAMYNEGNGYYKEKDYADAIIAYEEAMEIANMVGGDADELKERIQTNLLKAYYGNATAFYKKGKFDEAIAGYEKSYAYAEKVGDSKKMTSSKNNIAKVRTSKGTSYLKNNKADDALAEFNMALEIYPTYYKTYYGMMLAYKSKGDLTKMVANADKVLEYGGNNPKAAKTVAKTKSTVSKSLVNAGAKEIQKENATKAVDYINASFTYASGSANAYYYLTLAYSIENNWNKAISSAEKAINIDPTKDKSDVYFALGQAYEGNGDSSNACSAYKSVTNGPNVDAAKYQIAQVLKCG